ncbi:MAG TPA: CoB--CoM heterodisulfide reductase iron-sulfur subunit A family protein [Bacteroidia bacterium]|nr:CoB--CoM heterodisulfide reductase iron-sulfur subunit A family protein [Bacteroidia bacterium]HRS60016.1 CoB--CoM heterodisulfide reductase iron-sulfur subunit A family protein [Bacteroidia bacterium]HRU69307.1 CoB--CoM heterodisulfide reductase iron-sulfur subunit A family protein [Bacteroidia bacterium]
MKGTSKTAVCLYNAGSKKAGLFNFKEIKDFLRLIPEIRTVWDFSSGVQITVKKLSEQLKAIDIEKIIIAGDYPGEIKDMFRQSLSLAGKDDVKIVLADFACYASLNGHSTEMAKGLILCALNDKDYEEILFTDKTDLCRETLVIGGGIAGIQASLEIANGGNKVYLLEKTGTIGGHMAMFDKTFPTLDCAACILTPKMVEVGQHPNIEILTYSELTSVNGGPGNYTVKIHKKARRVNLATCIGCGTCAEKCPSKSPSEFDSGTSLRKAIYIPFPQAVPNKYLIDAEHCTYVQSGKCRVCEKVCPVPGCINLDEQDQDVELKVGQIIVATGFQLFNPSKVEQFGYGKYPNVLTSLEFERLINAAGPTGGNITFRTQDKKGNWVFENGAGEPQSIAIIHCVGSRDENYHAYCSKVCCMYSLKLAHLVKEKLHHADVFEYYIDMRAFGKGYEEFYQRIKEEGVKMIRGKTAKITEKNGKLILRSEDILNEKIIEQEVDMVILAAGLEPREDAVRLAEMLGLTTDEHGWFNEANYNFDPVNTFSGGIMVAGVCQGPKDIPDTVAQASAAASRVLQSLINNKVAKNYKDITLKEIETRLG